MTAVCTQTPATRTQFGDSVPKTDRELLEQILAETEKTNGRVSELERTSAATKRVLYGDPHDPADAGLVGVSKDVRRVVTSHDRVVKVVTWASVTIGTALIMAIITFVLSANGH